MLEGRGDTRIILTGRDAKPELIDYADTVTEMAEIKHAYHAGIRAQQGIDFWQARIDSNGPSEHWREQTVLQVRNHLKLRGKPVRYRRCARNCEPEVPNQHVTG